MPWQAWSPQQAQNQPWKQGWRGPTYGNMPNYLYPSQQYPQYSPQNQQTQYPPQIQQPYPTQAQQPQISQPQQLQLPTNQPPPRPTQLLLNPFQIQIIK
jgi:hypothetical protein